MTSTASRERGRVAALRAELALAHAHQAATAEILQIISRSPANVQRVLDAIAERAARLCDAPDVEVFRVEGEILRLAAGFGPLYEETRRTAPTTWWQMDGSEWERGARASVPGRVLLERRTLVIDDLAAVPVAELPAGVARRLGIRSLVATPIVRDQELLGLISVRRREARPFASADVQLLEAFATQAVIAIENARLLQQLEAASRHKSEFLANMSHELRTPLNAINGFAQLLLLSGDEEYDTATRRSYLATIYDSGQHLLQLINDILDLSKIEAGKMELRLGNVDLAALIASAVATVEALATRKSILLSVDAVGVGEIVADEGKVKQILYNLLSNAIKFTPDGGAVAVEAKRLPDAMQLTVADTGIGIAAADQERIFEEFRQIDSSASRHFEGTGQGLALTKRLVELHGGRIWVASAPGEGSQFHVHLPVQAPGLIPLGGVRGAGENTRAAAALPSPASSGVAPDGVPADVPRPEAGRSLDRQLVLVVEDDERAASLLRIYLGRGGYRTVVARDGRQALDHARTRSPVAITLDLLLPDVDGWEVLRALKLDPATRDIPVVIASVVDDQPMGYALGAVDYLVKPIDGQDLLTRLGRYTFTTKARQREVRVLVVDDDPLAVDLLAGMLAPAGFAVLRAYSGAEAIASARESHPHVMLLDLMMPDGTGFDVVAALKADPATREIAILVVTAKDLTAEDKAALNGHVAAVFEKGSVLRDDLLAWLRRLTLRSAPGASSATVAGPD